MSTAAASSYDVTLHQLSPDASATGLDYAATPRAGLSAKALRGLLKNAAALAPSVTYPLTPELRVTAPTGAYVIQLKEGRLHFVSWASQQSRGGAPTPDQIFGFITGELVEGDAGLPETAAPQRAATGSRTKRRLAIAALIVVFVTVNTFTIFHAKRPPGNFLPPYQLLEPATAERLLGRVAGDYETGSHPGDRRLEIARDGTVQWIKFGPARAATERKTFTVRGVEVAGAPALLTSRPSLITIKDPLTLVLFGDTYVRVTKQKEPGARRGLAARRGNFTAIPVASSAFRRPGKFPLAPRES